MPVPSATELVTLSITVQGQPVKPTYQVSSVTVIKGVNSIPVAHIQIFDGDDSQEPFAAANAADFVPGNTIEVSAGYEESTAVIFSGIIVAQGIKLQGGAPVLLLECNDAAMKMTIGKDRVYFEQMSDSTIIKKVINNYGLSASVDDTGIEVDTLVQYDSTGWDFILSRAGVNSMVVIPDKGKVSVKKIDTSAQPVLEIIYGDTMYNFDLEMDARTQLSSVQACSWDYATQAVSRATSQPPSLPLPGNIATATLAKVTAPSVYLLRTSASVDQKRLSDWANAKMTKSVMSKIRGTISFQGSSQASPGALISISGLGPRFDGNAFVSGVKHTIAEGNWTTEVSVGLPAGWTADSKPGMEAPLLPGMQGLQVGTVSKISGDPQEGFRVLVQMPITDTGVNTVWARMAGFYASTGAGSMFYPEVGDEVILGFVNNDPACPVILGSMYSKTRPPYSVPDERNTHKSIVTRSKLKIDFDDESKIITIATPGNNTIVMDDMAKSIIISDDNKNSIRMASGGITIDSGTNITIRAKGNINMTSGGNTLLTATSNIDLSALQFSATAQTIAKISANASAELSSSAILTLKGTLVKIN